MDVGSFALDIKGESKFYVGVIVELYIISYMSYMFWRTGLGHLILHEGRAWHCMLVWLGLDSFWIS